MSATSILDDLQARSLLALTTDREALAAVLGSGSVPFYVGFDPTAPSLHIGNLVQILTARRLQDAGHRPLALVGGATGLIGDPSGKSAERSLNERDVVAGWVERIRSQVSRFLAFEGPAAATMVNNLDWTASVSAIDFLRDVGKHFPVNRMLDRESVSVRLAAGGLSYTEFSYQVLQANDFLELHRRHGCVLQFGGSDQWGNITAGVDLVRRVTGTGVHAFATPLVTKADGTKFGKTETGTVWLDPELTSPYAFYQFWLNADDADVVRWMPAFSLRPVEEIAALAEETRERPAARPAQRALAEELTTLVHGADATARVVAASRALFGQGDLAALDGATLESALAELPRAKASRPFPRVADLLADAGVCASRSAARRDIAGGGAYVNNAKVSDPDALLREEDVLAGRWVVLRRGKRALAAVEVL
ncbi:tyrosyl-tRNA synthetase [Motilibacter rhizosphaerae]|uniref:Tyrosine--tRNA ligase n=1 Tax=Motilibacter rhizosphaerae TaxID=598652 RepID=A0A4Q7NRF2_9ACTN|nr:tyrosine--tRNA ligase [Motilibacter rhizosphaerae]RZS89338.1 tyrosyl-tRNA synthetase [Motilibacter rhizosphaerae]